MSKIEINGKRYTEEELRRGYRVITGLDDEELALDELVEYMTQAMAEDRVKLSDLRAMVESLTSPWEAAKLARTQTSGAYEYLVEVLAASSMHSASSWKENMLAACEDVAFNFGLSMQ